MSGVASSSSLSQKPSAGPTSSQLVADADKSAIGYGHQSVDNSACIEAFVENAVQSQIRVFRHYSAVIKHSPYRTTFMDSNLPLAEAVKAYSHLVQSGMVSIERFGLLMVRGSR